MNLTASSFLVLALLVGSLSQDHVDQAEPEDSEYPSVLSIDEAVAVALENAFVIRIAESRVDQARYRERAASGQLGPRITFDANYTRFEVEGGVSGGATGGGTGGATGGGTGGATGGGQGGFFAGSGDSKTVQISLVQPIDISGTTRASVRAAEFATLAQEAGLGVDVNDLKRDVRSRYFLVLQAQADVAIQAALIEESKQRLENARSRFEAGDIPRFDVLRLESDLLRSEQQLVDAYFRYVLAKQGLNVLLGWPVETEYEVVGVGELPGVEESAIDLYLVALRNRPEVEQLGFQIESLGQVASAEEAGRKPTLAISASHQRNIDPGFGQARSTSLGGLQLSVPIFDSGITRNRVLAAREDEEQAKILFEQVLLGISLEVRQALTQLMNAAQALQVAVQAEEVAREALRIARLRFDEGEGILLEVTSAQAELVAAQGSLVRAQSAYLTGYAELQRAVGRDDLGRGEERGEQEIQDEDSSGS